ncbi:acyltransferase family protein [Tunturiibacter gelidiferens]|uniref:acyltransferase family protein n=1 Tax=Tunturiibacter gelidiferens TaxID=3069689 RepID=UPI003D9AB9B0
MRGLAALVVVFHHFYLMFYRAQFQSSPITSLIYPLVAGRESVMLFFVLSGFVLALPLMKRKTASYPTYVWKRVLRIYGPYLGALALAVAACAIWHGQVPSFAHGDAPWAGPVNLGAVLQAVFFIGPGNDLRYNQTFWSLVHEMRISILFPFLFAAVGRLGGLRSLLLVAFCTLIGVQGPGSHFFGDLSTIQYLGMFAMGILLAKHRIQIQHVFHRLTLRGRLLFAWICCMLYYGSHMVGGLWWHLGDMPVAVGAAGFIVLGLNSSKAKALLHVPAIRFLGKISYSLYLVHMTVLCALTALLSHRINHSGLLLVYLTTCILLSWGFYLAVELPFMKLSRQAGTRNVTPQQKEISEGVFSSVQHRTD